MTYEIVTGCQLLYINKSFIISSGLDLRADESEYKLNIVSRIYKLYIYKDIHNSVYSIEKYVHSLGFDF